MSPSLLRAVAFLCLTCCSASVLAQAPDDPPLPDAAKARPAKKKPARKQPAPKAAAGAGGQIPVERRAVDMVSLATGERFLGMFAGPATGGKFTFFVSRDWLRTGLPRYYQDFAARELDQTRATLEQVRDRVAAWKERRADRPGLIAFLDEKLVRIEKQLTDLDDDQRILPQIIAIEAPEADVKRRFMQTPANRRLLGWAWEQRLADAELRAPGVLKKQLVALGVDPVQRDPDLSDRLGPTPQSAEAWAAREAAVEYQVLGEPHFQGTGGALIRAGQEEDLAGLGDLFKGLAGGNLERQLGELLGQPADDNDQEALDRSVKKATSEAEAAGFVAVRVTHLTQSLERGDVRVAVRLLARMPDGAWRDIWRGENVADANNVRPEDVKKTAEDPQVKKALDLVKGLGIPLDESLMEQALRHGAATQEALRLANAAANEFLLAAARRFDGPPLQVLAADARGP